MSFPHLGPSSFSFTLTPFPCASPLPSSFLHLGPSSLPFPLLEPSSLASLTLAPLPYPFLTLFPVLPPPDLLSTALTLPSPLHQLDSPSQLNLHPHLAGLHIQEMSDQIRHFSLYISCNSCHSLSTHICKNVEMSSS
jgi:hypothetical protein